MTSNHIDQLREWWESAEEGIPSAGDTVIFDERHRGLGFHITQATKDHPRGYDNARILARAPKPKPAWHDAVAVIAASTVGDQDGGGPVGRVFERVEHLGGREVVWAHGDIEYETEELCDVTPLIEAKVTDEMVERLEGHFLNTANMALPEGLARRMLTAALGLETE